MSDQIVPASNEASGARVIATSIILILFTLAVGLACMVLLACTLSQGRMTKIVVDGVAISIWKLDDVRKHWSDIREQLLHQADDLAAADKELASAQKNYNETDAKFRPQFTALERQLETFNFGIRTFDSHLAQDIDGKGFTQQVSQINAAKDELAAHSDLQPLIDRINATYKLYEPLYEVSERDKAALQAAKQKVSDITNRVKSLQTALDGMFTDFSNQPIDKATRTRLEGALFELYSESGKIGAVLNSIITLPPEILTLLLVISMGILGSALQMTHALFRNRRIEGPGAYCLRLSVGAITALVIFIVAKAGVPVIADASQLGGDAPINPYFVSFLAIISGLMSESAIISVERQGQKLFVPEETEAQQRWARYDLHDAFKKADRDPKAVQQLLNVGDDEFNAWISGNEAMPVNAQMMLSAVLAIPVRDIMTDIGPDGVVKAAAPSQ